jgi:hypothetical protein
MDISIKTAELGHPFTHSDLKSQCRAICGGVAWPGQRPGFAVVLGMGNDKHFDSYDIYLLDEFQSTDMRELVRQCGALDLKYEPDMWIGDNRNDAADRFILEANIERGRPDDSQINVRCLSICSTEILEMTFPYQYILPELKHVLDSERRQLFLKSSKTVDFLADIQSQEISALEIGGFPAIEALAFAAFEIRRYGPHKRKSSRRSERPQSPMVMA